MLKETKTEKMTIMKKVYIFSDDPLEPPTIKLVPAKEVEIEVFKMGASEEKDA